MKIKYVFILVAIALCSCSKTSSEPEIKTSLEVESHEVAYGFKELPKVCIERVSLKLKNNPGDPFLLQERAACYEKLKMHNEAIQDLDVALELVKNLTKNDKPGQPVLGYGGIPFQGVTLTPGTALIRQNSSLHHQHEILFSRANIKYIALDYSGAVDDFTKALEIDPDDYNSFTLKIFALLESGNITYPDAMKDLGEARSLSEKAGDAANVDLIVRLMQELKNGNEKK